MTTASSRPWRRAAAWLAFLGPFFFASYGFATWVTAQRTVVGALAFEWERAIPFVPWTIVPYWSIDLLYAISLFACADRRELDTHAKRLLTAQLVAVASFLAWPLRFSFDRPEADGVFGALFDVLGTFDKPFNQAPSLHIALLVILWDLHVRKLRGAARLALHAWFALIGVSVLTTWQHHFIDVPTGALLGSACMWAWPRDVRSPLASFRWTRDGARRRLAWRYAFGAGLLALAASRGGAALWLAWPAVSLGLVALIYAALAADAFGKRDGALPAASLALLGPYVAGAWLNARLWTGWTRNAAEVADGVLIGPLPTAASLARDRVDAIVDLAAELPVDRAGRRYAAFPVLDLVVADPRTLADAAATIERFRRDGGRVLVCCALGYSRSASAVAAWLVATGRARDAESAIALVRRGRPHIVLHGLHRAAVDSAATATAG